MSDEKPQPFVVYRADDTGRADDGWSIFVGGVRIPTRLGYDEIEPVAEAARVAVEAREAKLRGALVDLIHDAGQLTFECDGVVGTRMPSRPAYNAAWDALNRAKGALGGTGPEYVQGDVACGLAFDLGQWQATVRDLQVMVDALTDENPTERAVIAPFLEAMGLRKTTLADLSDGDLAVLMRDARAEADHRNWAGTNLATALSDQALSDEFHRRSRERVMPSPHSERSWARPHRFMGPGTACDLPDCGMPRTATVHIID